MPSLPGTNPRDSNPLFGPNRFKLGIFSANCDGGLTLFVQEVLPRLGLRLPVWA